MILHYKKGGNICAIFFPSATRPGGGGGSEASLYNFKTAPDKATTKFIENNVLIISIIWLHNLIDTITIIGRHSPLSRGGHFVAGDQEKLCLCTAGPVERTRVAVHKQSFSNLLRQNGCLRDKGLFSLSNEIRTAYYHSVNPQISPLPNKPSLFTGRKFLSPPPPPSLIIIH